MRLWHAVLDRTFRPDRHGELLATDDLPERADQELRELQAAFRAADSPRQRGAIARDFQEAVKRGDSDSYRRRLEGALAEMEISPILGLLVPEPLDKGDMRAETVEFRRRGNLLARASRLSPPPPALERFLVEWNAPINRGSPSRRAASDP